MVGDGSRKFEFRRCGFKLDGAVELIEFNWRTKGVEIKEPVENRKLYAVI